MLISSNLTTGTAFYNRRETANAPKTQAAEHADGTPEAETPLKIATPFNWTLSEKEEEALYHLVKIIYALLDIEQDLSNNTLNKTSVRITRGRREVSARAFSAYFLFDREFINSRIWPEIQRQFQAQGMEFHGEDGHDYILKISALKIVVGETTTRSLTPQINTNQTEVTIIPMKVNIFNKSYE